MNDAEDSSQPNGDDAAGDGEANDNQEEESRPAGPKEIAVRIGAIANVVVQAINIGFVALKNDSKDLTRSVGEGMVYGSSAIGVVHSPVVAYKERQLTKEDTFRTALNGIREQQGRLAGENDVLSAEIDGLQSEVDRMKDVESALRELSETQGSQLDELMDLIEENKKINEGLRECLKNKVLEEVIGIVLDIDNDGSFTIQDKEIDRLIISMKLIQDGGVVFDDDMFRKEVVACDGNVDEVIMLIKKMILGSCEGEDNGRETQCQIDVNTDPDEYFNRLRSKSGK